MTIQRQDEQIADGGGQRTVVADPPVARDESVVQEQVVQSSAGGLDMARGWVRSLGGIILVALAVVETLCRRLGFSWPRLIQQRLRQLHLVSKPLAEPFQGIVAQRQPRIRVAIAMGVYAVAALLLIAALFAITAALAAARHS